MVRCRSWTFSRILRWKPCTINKWLITFERCFCLRCATVFQKFFLSWSCSYCFCFLFLMFHFNFDKTDEIQPFIVEAGAGFTTEVGMRNDDDKIGKFVLNPVWHDWKVAQYKVDYLIFLDAQNVSGCFQMDATWRCWTVGIQGVIQTRTHGSGDGMLWCFGFPVILIRCVHSVCPSRGIIMRWNTRVMRKSW